MPKKLVNYHDSISKNEGEDFESGLLLESYGYFCSQGLCVKGTKGALERAHADVQKGVFSLSPSLFFSRAAAVGRKEDKAGDVHDARHWSRIEDFYAGLRREIPTVWSHLRATLEPKSARETRGVYVMKAKEGI